MKYSFLFSPNYFITLIDCQVKNDILIANLSRFDANLEPGKYPIKENAIASVCGIRLPEWAISNETLIFLEPIELEIVNDR